MQSSVVAKGAPVTQRAYVFGSILAIIGGLMVLASAFFTWQAQVIGGCCGQSPTVIPYFGGSLGVSFGIIGIFLAALPFTYREHAPIGAIGGLFGWWIAGLGAMLFLILNSYQPQAGIFIALCGAGVSLIGSVLLMEAARPDTPVVINPQRQRLAVVALLLAAGTPFSIVIYNLFVPYQALSGITILVGLGLLFAAIIVGAIAMQGESDAELPYRFRLMCAMAIALAPGVLIGTLLGLVYLFQNMLHSI